MKKRLMCLMLGLVTLLSVFLTSCSGEETDVEDIAADATRETQTLVVYLMSEAPVDEKTTADIEDEINELTKAKYKTQLDLHFYTSDTYYTEVEKKLNAKEKEIKAEEKAAKDKKKYEKWLKESCKQASISYVPVTTPKPQTVITEEATLVDPEYGIIKYVYPEPEENQLDIFYVGGYDRYIEYSEGGWLARLNDELDMSSKKLKEHIPSIYMDNLKTDGGIYGIPTNSAVGEYTWMLLDKDLMDYFMYLDENIDYLVQSNEAMDEDLYDFLNDVNTYARYDSVIIDGEARQYVPVKGDLEPAGMFYWSVDPETLRLTNEPSVVGASYNQYSQKGADMSINRSLFAHNKYTNQLKMIKRFEVDGFYATEEEANKHFAMTVIKGGYDVYEQYSEDYYVKMVECPRASEDDIFGNMICVSDLEDNISRSMEIVTYLNTNSEARNIIQYGIEGENYYIDEDGVLHRYNQSYMMDVKKTGNVFMAHPEEGKVANYWDQWVKQNEDAKVYPTFGFRIYWDDDLDTGSLDELQKLSDVYMEEIDACTTLEELEAFFTKAKADINVNKYYLFAKADKEENIPTDLTPDDPSDDEAIYFSDMNPLMKIYADWRRLNGYLGD